LSSLLWWKEYYGVLNEICTFHPSKLDIVAYFKDGKAVLFRYRHKDRSQMTNDEISSILNVAVTKAHWIRTSAGNRFDLRWRTSDSSVFAYYFQGPNSAHAFYEGPRYSVLIQTAPIDMVYKRMNREKAEGVR